MDIAPEDSWAFATLGLTFLLLGGIAVGMLVDSMQAAGD